MAFEQEGFRAGSLSENIPPVCWSRVKQDCVLCVFLASSGMG